MNGDIVVAGLVTGTHVIEDIQIVVPHKVAVHIPAEAALRSKDLWRAINEGRVFKLDGGSGLRTSTPMSSAAQTARVNQLEAANAQLQAENKKLRQELATANIRYESLQQVLAGFQGQLQGLQGVLGRLEGLPNAIQGMVMLAPGMVPQGMVAVQSAAAPEVVGGEVPRFIPEAIKPAGATTQIEVQAETSDGSSLSAATSRLRSLRKGQKS